MSSEEWLEKYNKMIALAIELYKCPNTDPEIRCYDCAFHNKCAIVSATITLSHIR